MLRATVKFLLLTEAFAVGTFAMGWWAVPAVAFAWAVVVDSRSRPVFFATLCAMAGWGSVLLLDAARGPLDVVAQRFGGIIGFPPIVLIALTILFPALLAWSASSVGVGIRSVAFGRRVEQSEPAATSQPQPTAGEVVVADA
ncbi:MAG TPA: hypothetical protein VJB15_01605 [Rhodothermia bacterium]|nr:hypothetical protein [Rhodothermia bacterium]